MPNKKNRERNKRVVRRVLRAWNRKKESFFPSHLISPALVTHFGNGSAGAGARARSRELEVVLPNSAFPDQRFEEQILIADDKSVFIGWEFIGTHKGPLYGRRATGKAVTVHGADFYRLENGLIVEHWDFYSKTRVHVLAKLGLLDRKMQQYLINTGLLGRNYVTGRVANIQEVAKKFALE